MTLTETIAIRQNGRATALNRRRQSLSELRVDEGVRWLEQSDMIGAFRTTDAIADKRIERLIRLHYASLDTDEQRATFTAFVRAYLSDEASEDRSVAAQDDHAATAFAEHRANTPVFVNGAAVPHGSGDVA